MTSVQTVPNSFNANPAHSATVEACTPDQHPSPAPRIALPPYELRNKFSYSLRCRYCRTERAHTEAQHAKAVTAWAPGDDKW
jgi:hypothetical protein